MESGENAQGQTADERKEPTIGADLATGDDKTVVEQKTIPTTVAETKPVQDERVELAYVVPDAPAETPHHIYRFKGTEHGAEVRVTHSRGGRMWTVQAVKFTGVEVNNFTKVGQELAVTSEGGVKQMLADLAEEYKA